MIGAWGAYVVFGDVPPVLVNNSLQLFSGDKVILGSDYIAAYDYNHNNSTLVFIPNNIVHGQFELVSSLGLSVGNFTQQAVTEGLIQFVHDGGTEPPAYDMTVRSDGIAWVGPTAAQISFTALTILRNQLTINQGETRVLTSDNLYAAGGSNDRLNFTIMDVQQGHFESILTPDETIASFVQQEILDQQIIFIHNDSAIVPNYTVTVSNGGAISSPQAAIIDFDAKPILENNQLIIDQGQSVILNSSNLYATHEGSSGNALIFMISNFQYGYFAFTSSPQQPILVFQQQNITDSVVSFSHDNSVNAPAYIVSVTDGRVSSDPQAASIDFDTFPILLNNTLLIHQGESVILTQDILSAIHPMSDDNVLLFTISNSTHGQFNWITFPDQPIVRFYQQNITNQKVQFSHDNSTQMPGYLVTVSDGRITLPSCAVETTFYRRPVIVKNQLILHQGETVMMTNDFLNVTADYPSDQVNLIVDQVQQGQFQLVSDGTVMTQFTQQQLETSQVRFVQNGSNLAPQYTVGVIDPYFTLPPTAIVNTTFYRQPVITTNQLSINQGQTVVMTSSQLNGIDDYLRHK